MATTGAFRPKPSRSVRWSASRAFSISFAFAGFPSARSRMLRRYAPPLSTSGPPFQTATSPRRSPDRAPWKAADAGPDRVPFRREMACSAQAPTFSESKSPLARRAISRSAVGRGWLWPATESATCRAPSSVETSHSPRPCRTGSPRRAPGRRALPWVKRQGVEAHHEARPGGITARGDSIPRALLPVLAPRGPRKRAAPAAARQPRRTSQVIFSVLRVRAG